MLSQTASGSSLRHALVASIAVLLLAAAPLAASGSDEPQPWGAPAPVETVGPPAYFTFEYVRGTGSSSGGEDTVTAEGESWLRSEGTEIAATDPRASGLLTSATNRVDSDAGDGRMRVSSSVLLISNDGGTWVGTAKYFTYAGDPEETPRTIVTVGFTEFVGQGGYEGMRLFLVEQPNSVGERNWGIILPVDRLPETPELVPEPSAVDIPVVGGLPAAEGEEAPLATLVDQTSATIDPAAGGEVHLGGARLTIPAGALSAPASVTMWQVDVPETAGGISGGQRRLFEHAYGFRVDAPVALSAPVQLSLPVDTSRLQGDLAPEALRVSSVLGGFLIPQEFPVTYDLSAASLVVTMDLPELAPGLMKPQGIPQAAGFPILAMIASLVRIGAAVGAALPNVQALGATLDEAQPEWAYDVIETPHFLIRYQRGAVDAAAVQPVADALERAHALFVEELGFALPNAWNPDGRYSVYLDNFDLHTWPGMDATADGVTLPGSAVLEGASYVNNLKDPAIWPITAAHEYFHAVTWGQVGQWTPNSLNMLLNPRSSWLFEGTAAALSARVIHGGGTTAARDPAQDGIPTIESLDNAEIVKPADRTQDFFFYLERTYGSADFYPRLFQALRSDIGGSAPSAARAVDRGLSNYASAAGKDPGGLSAAWRGFVEDYLFTSPDRYGAPAEPSNARKPLSECPGRQGYRFGLPPLSYDYHEYTIPELEKDANGVSLPGQAVDLVIDFGDTDQPPLGVLIELPDGRLIEGTQASTDRTVFPSMRFDDPEDVRLVIVNPYFAGDVTIPVSWSVCLDAPGWTLATAEYPHGRSLSGTPYCYGCTDPGRWTETLSESGILYIREERKEDGSISRAWTLDVGVEVPPTLGPDGEGEMLITAALDVTTTDPVGYPPTGKVTIIGHGVELTGSSGLDVTVASPVDQVVVPFRVLSTSGDVAVIEIAAPQSDHSGGEVLYVYRRDPSGTP